MRRIVLLSVVAAIIATATTFLAGQSAKPTIGTPFGESSEPIFSAQAGRVPTVATFVNAPGNTISVQTFSPLQQRFVDLSGDKARMLKEDQLQKAVTELEHELDSLNASARLDAAVKILEEVIAKHDGSDAARAARAALDVIDNERSSHTKPHSSPKIPVPPIEKKGASTS